MLFKGVYGNDTCYSFMCRERVAEINRIFVRKRRIRLYRKAVQVRLMRCDRTKVCCVDK